MCNTTISDLLSNKQENTRQISMMFGSFNGSELREREQWHTSRHLVIWCCSVFFQTSKRIVDSLSIDVIEKRGFDLHFVIDFFSLPSARYFAFLLLYIVYLTKTFCHYYWSTTVMNKAGFLHFLSKMISYYAWRMRLIVVTSFRSAQ